MLAAGYETFVRVIGENPFGGVMLFDVARGAVVGRPAADRGRGPRAWRGLQSRRRCRPRGTSPYHFTCSLDDVIGPNGAPLAAGHDSAGGVMLFDVAGCARLVDQPLAVAEGNVTTVAFSPDGKTLAAGYNSDRLAGGVMLFDVARPPGWSTSRSPWPRATSTVWLSVPMALDLGRGVRLRRRRHRSVRRGAVRPPGRSAAGRGRGQRHHCGFQPRRARPWPRGMRATAPKAA